MDELRRPDWRRDWLAWLIIAIPAVAALGFLSIWGELGQPFGGFVSFNRARLATGEVDANTPIWWAGLLGEGVKLDDTLIEANGRPFYPDARDVFQEAAAAGATSVTLLVERAGAAAPLEVELPVLKFKVADIVDLRLPDWISAVAYWVLAIVVYLARPTAAPNRAFATVACTVAISRSNFVHSLYMDPDFLTNASETALIVGTSFLGVAVIHFASLFPHPLRSYRSWMPRVLLAIGLIITALYLYSRTPFALPPSWPSREAIEGVAQLTAVLVLAVGLVVALSRLVWLIFRQNSNRRERNVLLIVGVGWLISLPFLLTTIAENLGILPLDAVYNWAGLDLRYLLQGIALSFAFVLLRYQAFQAPSRLFLFVFVISGSALLAAVGAWLWTLGFADWPENGLRPPFFALFLAATVAGLFWVSQTSWGGVFGRLLHRERTSYVAARLFGERVMGRTDLTQLPQTITDALVSELQLDCAVLWMPAKDSLRSVAQSGAAFHPPPLPVPNAAASDLSRAIHLPALDELPAWLAPLAGQSELEIAVPLVADDQLLGVLGLGQRWDEEIFDDKDMEIAEIVGQQATLFLVAAKSNYELRRVPGRMADLQEQERTRLAQELHDTIQQFLGRLPFYLAVSRDTYDANPDRAVELLNRSINDVEDAARSVRLIRQNLAPSQLEGGLTMPLITLASQFQNRTGLPIELRTDPNLDAFTTVETRHALYRVLQQALDNVEMHAKAEQVVIHVQCDDGQVVFSVTDDGRGSSEAERASAVTDGSFGLQSMRARLESCDGQFYFESEPGQGTEVRGQVPAAPQSSNGAI